MNPSPWWIAWNITRTVAAFVAGAVLLNIAAGLLDEMTDGAVTDWVATEDPSFYRD